MSTAAAQAAPSTEQFGTLLSPSQVATFTDCSARWYFKYAAKLADPKNANLAFGIAAHEAIGMHLRYKASGVALEPADAAEHFTTMWKSQLATEAILRDEDDPAAFNARGRALVSHYVAEIAPTIDVAAVEERVEGVINGVRVQGRVDIREKDGTIRDIKTAARKPCGVSNQHAFQLATYFQLTPAAAPLAVVDTLVKTQSPQVVTHAHRIDACEVEAARRMYPLVQIAIQSEVYVPNRASSLCSRKNCSFWRACEAEFGGRVSQ